MCFVTRLAFFVVVVLATTVTVLHLVHLCRKHGAFLRYSVHFKGHDLEGRLAEEQLRMREAEAWLKDLRDGQFLWPSSKKIDAFSPEKDLCVAVVTAERNGQPSPYVAHSMHRLFRNLTRAEFARIRTVAVIRGPNPLPDVFAHFDQVVSAQDAADQQMLQFTNLRDETVDYITALKYCQESPLVLVLQDDLHPVRHALRAVRYVVRQADETAPSWASIKLFYHEFWDGWSTESTPKLVLFVALVTLCTFLLASRGFAWAMYDGRLEMQPILLALYVAACAGFLAGWIPYSLGRQHVLPAFYPGLNGNRGSAAVAIVYNNRNKLVEKLIQFLENSKSSETPVDLLIDSFFELISLQSPSFIWSPSLFQHTGVFSSIKHKSGGSSSMLQLSLRLVHFKESLTFRDNFLWA